MQLASAVGGQKNDRAALGGNRPQLWNRDRKVGQELEQERLELVVGAVDLVDQQHHRPSGIGFDRVKQGPVQQEAARKQLAFVHASLSRPHRQQLARVVPVIDGVVQVDPLVTLQADQPSSE